MRMFQVLVAMMVALAGSVGLAMQSIMPVRFGLSGKLDDDDAMTISTTTDDPGGGRVLRHSFSLKSIWAAVSSPVSLKAWLSTAISLWSGKSKAPDCAGMQVGFVVNKEVRPLSPTSTTQMTVKDAKPKSLWTLDPIFGGSTRFKSGAPDCDSAATAFA